jgi:hypothetical protein
MSVASGLCRRVLAFCLENTQPSQNVCLNVKQEAFVIYYHIMMLVRDSACIHNLIKYFFCGLSLDTLVQCYAFVDGIE